MNFGGNLKVVPADYETFQLNVEEADKYITERTKAVIINNPNNPSGVVYNKETLIRLQKMLEKAEERIDIRSMFFLMSHTVNWYMMAVSFHLHRIILRTVS